MRPLVILLVVLAAIGALLFAVLNLGHGPAPAPVDAPIKTEQPVKPPPTEPLTAKDPTARTAPTPVPNTVANGGPSDMQFDNRITGLVKNTLGAVVVGAEVTLSTYGTEDMFFINDPRPDPAKEPKARTDSDGRYTFLGIEPRAKYALIVTHPQYAMKKELSMPIGESGVIEQAPIILAAGATLSGYVKDEAGNLIPDATLNLDGEEWLGFVDPAPDRLTTHTNNEGWFSFVNIAPGRRSVGIAAPGYGKIQVGGMAFQKEEQYSRDFTLKIAAMICGRVVTEGDKGVPNATVIAIAVSNTQQTGRDQVLTNDKGEFCFEKLVPGDYNLIASAKGWRSLPGRNNRVSSNTSNLIIEMMKEGSVCGTVIDGASGQPVGNFTVRMRFSYGEQQATAPVSEEVLPVVNAKGEFCIEGVAPSDYVVEASAPGYSPSFSSTFTVLLGKSVKDIVVKLNRGGSITGRILDNEGKPIARARVVTHDNTWTDDLFTQAIGISMPTNATTVEARTDDAGRFTCTGLTPETYQIVITANGFAGTSRNNLRVGDAGVAQAGDIKLGRGGMLKGTLFDEAGAPISGGTITLKSTDGVMPQEQTTKSGADGKFVFSNRHPGRYLLSGMRAAGGQMNPFEQLAQSSASQVNVVVGEGEVTTQDLRLQP